MEFNETRLRQECLQGLDLTGLTQRHDVYNVMEDDSHPGRLCEDGKSGTDAAGTQHLSPNLLAPLRLLVPDSIPHLPHSLEVLVRKGNDLRHYKLGDGMGVGEGGMEDGDTCFRSGGQVGLIGANPERGEEYAFCNPSCATDSKGVALMDLLPELIFRHGLGRVIYMPALILECSDSLQADIFDEGELKVLAVHGVRDFWLTVVQSCATAPPPGPIVEKGSCEGDGEGVKDTATLRGCDILSR